MAIIDTYPHIRAAALVIAYDNGMVNRFHDQQEFIDGTDFVLGADGVDTADLVAIDAFLGTLSKEDLETLCAGEETEATAVAARAGDLAEKVDGLLQDIFEGDA